MKRILWTTTMIAVMICLCACSRLPDGDVDITLNDVAEANSLDALLERYDNVFIQEDTVNINGYVDNTRYYSFAEDDGRFVADIWQDDENNRMTVNARGGVIYGMYDGDMDAAIVPEEDYNDQIREMYPLLPLSDEELQSAVKTEKEILVTTVRETLADGSVSLGAEYRLNARTLRIESLQVITFNEKGQKSQIVGMTVTHNSKEEPDRSAWKNISDPADGSVCIVTAVIEPGTELEEKRNLQVARSCTIGVTGKSGYDFYSDEACRNLIPVVDTMGERITFYAKAAE